MTREDRFLDVFGKIDDKFLVSALPGAFDLDLGTTVIHAGNNIEPIEVTEKDIRRYRIMQAVKYSTAAAVVIAAGALLWANWDKIAVSAGNSQPAVTTQGEVFPGAASQGTTGTVISLDPPITVTTTTDTTTADIETDITPANSNDYSEFFSATGEEPTEVDLSEELTFTIEQRGDQLLCTWSINDGSFLEQSEIKAYAMLYSEDGSNYSELKTYEPDTDKCGWSLEGTDERPLYFMLQCIFTYEDRPFLGYSESVMIE